MMGRQRVRASGSEDMMEGGLGADRWDSVGEPLDDSRGEVRYEVLGHLLHTTQVNGYID